ncbi:Oidioi.mRNA.OKI2018_I69.chr2.g8171.t1.cds [Oikopleura dioica]|uniref:Oidioi.mRNA.OKI2018_I69.chr2.g8171.t1.cds n=1 Tax=Oikopleura dioica TaxID=34765 RepID=A0ABN7TD34_OIKDI|nr:Oidioi.mRNA.OKI2018_I69.chr2.g8171.t1.cds [Oikopleura dioica]
MQAPNPSAGPSGARAKAIPTLRDSVVVSSSSAGLRQPPKRKIEITNDDQSLLNIEFDIDLGLLKRNIPPRELFEEDNEAWDWEQEFSKIAAEFSAQQSASSAKQSKKEVNKQVSSVPASAPIRL